MSGALVPKLPHCVMESQSPEQTQSPLPAPAAPGVGCAFTTDPDDSLPPSLSSCSHGKATSCPGSTDWSEVLEIQVASRGQAWGAAGPDHGTPPLPLPGLKPCSWLQWREGQGLHSQDSRRASFVPGPTSGRAHSWDRRSNKTEQPDFPSCWKHRSPQDDEDNGR